MAAFIGFDKEYERNVSMNRVNQKKHYICGMY